MWILSTWYSGIYIYRTWGQNIHKLMLIPSSKSNFLKAFKVLALPQMNWENTKIKTEHQMNRLSLVVRKAPTSRSIGRDLGWILLKIIRSVLITINPNTVLIVKDKSSQRKETKIQRKSMLQNRLLRRRWSTREVARIITSPRHHRIRAILSVGLKAKQISTAGSAFRAVIIRR